MYLILARARGECHQEHGRLNALAARQNAVVFEKEDSLVRADGCSNARCFPRIRGRAFELVVGNFVQQADGILAKGITVPLNRVSNASIKVALQCATAASDTPVSMAAVQVCDKQLRRCSGGDCARRPPGHAVPRGLPSAQQTR